MTRPNYTVATLAEHWGVSTTFVYALLQSGTLRGLKLGNKLWRIKPEAVEEFEERQAERQPEPVILPLSREEQRALDRAAQRKYRR